MKNIVIVTVIVFISALGSNALAGDPILNPRIITQEEQKMMKLAAEVETVIKADSLIDNLDTVHTFVTMFEHEGYKSPSLNKVNKLWVEERYGDEMRVALFSMTQAVLDGDKEAATTSELPIQPQAIFDYEALIGFVVTLLVLFVFLFWRPSKPLGSK